MTLDKSKTGFGGTSRLSAHYLADEATLLDALRAGADLSEQQRSEIVERASRYVADIRNNGETVQLMDAFLQEYGLSTSEGIALMRLSEALIRTPDFATSRLLIRDKLGDEDWAEHAKASDHGLVNQATNGLRLSAAWIKMSGGTTAKSLAAKLGDRVLETAVDRIMGIMGGHFVLGRTIEAAMDRAESNRALGFVHSYDMLGEAAFTAADADKYFKAYLQAVNQLAASGEAPYKHVSEAPGLSVKLSALHPRYEYAKRADCVPALIERVRSLALIAKEAGIGLTVDAEEADRLEVSLMVFEALMQDDALAGWDGLGIVVQAYQRRAIPLIEHLIDMAKTAGRTLPVRLVKGAYWDMEIKRAQELGLASYPVFTRKENTDVSYLACARKLIDAGDVIFPQFATHNAHTAAAIAFMAGQGRRFEYQRLHGMGEALHLQLTRDLGVRSRIYAPVGNHKDLLPYLVRRLLENGANSSFVNQLLDEAVSIDEITADPIGLTLANTPAANPKIRAPRDLFSGVRLSAYGIDLTQADTERDQSEALDVAEPYKASSLLEGEPIGFEEATIHNPANLAQTIGSITKASPEHVDQAVKIANRSDWANAFTAEQRSQCLHAAADLLEQDMDGFLKLCVLEAGKTLPDAVAEIREAVDFCRYYAVQAQAPRMARRAPLGTVACISPWNFPLAIFLGQIVAALSVGNTVVAKPAEQTPLISQKAVQLLYRAGVPADALHLLIGEGALLGARLTANPDIHGVCFTGSTATAKRIAASLAGSGRAAIPFIAETGGINAMIIDSTALMEQAVQDVIASAFQSAGQRCSACRLVAVQEDIAEDFITMLSGAMAQLEIGNPANLSTDIGPVIDADARQMIEDYIASSRKTFGVLAEKTSGSLAETGHFVSAIAFEIGGISDVTREVFGPVLHVLRFGSGEIEAIVDQINALGFGLTMGLHTRLDARIEAVAKRAHVGNLYVNRNQIGAVVGVQPFGGEGLSGTGPKAGGPHYLFRLSKRPDVPVENAGSAVAARAAAKPELSEQGAEIIDAARRAQAQWVDQFSQAERTKRLDEIFANHLIPSELQAFKVEQSMKLPGPTGEDNTLTLHPRGLLYLLPDADPSAAALQLALALYAGNAVIVAEANSFGHQLEPFLEKMRDHEIPKALVSRVSADLMPTILDEPIDGVIVSISDQEPVAAHLAGREGAIIPVLTLSDEPERFYHERTLTINTTAAGGNATLLGGL